MRVGILIVGHLRTSLENNILKDFINTFRNSFYKCDVFVHTWDTYEVTTSTPIHGIYDKSLQSKIVDPETIKKYINPTKIVVEHQDIAKIYGYKTKSFKVKVPYVSMKFLYYALLQAFNMCKDSCDTSGNTYDLIIRIRPDIYKFPCLKKPSNINKIITYMKTHEVKNKLVGFIHHPGLSLSDNFYFMNYQDAKIFFNNMYFGYDRMCDNYKHKLMPEAILKICTDELSLKRTVATDLITSIKDTFMFAAKNNVIKTSYNNLFKIK